VSWDDRPHHHGRRLVACEVRGELVDAGPALHVLDERLEQSALGAELVVDGRARDVGDVGD
jgi:hypothetical protein